MTTQQRSVLAALFASRKNAVALIYIVASIATFFASKLGIELSTEAAVATMTPWVALGVSQIFGIAWEDAAAKGAGAGATTTVTPTSEGGAEIKIVPDEGKP